MNTIVSPDFDFFGGKIGTKNANGPQNSNIYQPIQSAQQKFKAQQFEITFKVQYKTEIGQSLCIVGEIPELGQWKQFKALMKWTEGHVWQIDLSLFLEKAWFQYKYCVLNDGKPERWEVGLNRIADVELLKANQQKILFDQFDRYSVNFSMYYPLKNEIQDYMRINGDPEELGSWNKGLGPLRMQIAKKEIVWLTGEKVRPFEFTCMFKQGVCPTKIIYKYSIRNDFEETTVWEREPSRVLDILNPNLYNGQLGVQGSTMWRNVDQTFIVNGHIEKADANFVGSLTFDQIGDTGIFIGPYPQLEEDTDKMMSAGITGVLNVQTDIDHKHRGINWPKMCDFYQQRGIKAMHFPIHDFNEDSLRERLFEGAKCLNEMLKTQKVYVHCTAGMGRAPATVLVYLLLFKKVQCWHDIRAADQFIKDHRKVSTPNLRAVTAVIEQNKEFQKNQKESFNQ